MSEGESQAKSAGQALVELIAEGGLPQVIAGPGGKALSRLIGEAADIPAAWLQRYSQGIRDKTKANTAIRSAVASAAAKRAAKNTDLLDRSILSAIGDAARTQNNREKIAEKTFDNLRQEAPPKESPGPSDDWLNVFADHAGRASSESLQDIWARVLAGEIRKPGKFSYQTLQFISVLDPNIAKVFERYASEAFFGEFILDPSRFDFTPEYNELSLLNQYGLLVLGQTRRLTGAVPALHLFVANWFFVVELDDAKSVDWPVAGLSQVAREVYSILSPNLDPVAAKQLAQICLEHSAGKRCDLLIRNNVAGMAKDQQGYTQFATVFPGPVKQ